MSSTSSPPALALFMRQLSAGKVVYVCDDNARLGGCGQMVSSTGRTLLLPSSHCTSKILGKDLVRTGKWSAEEYPESPSEQGPRRPQRRASVGFVVSN